jgi:amylosucrase
MDWEAAERRHDPASVEGRLWSGLQRLIAARRRTRAIHVQGVTEPLWTGNDHVFGLLRERAGQRLLLLANFTPERQPVQLAVVHDHGFELSQDAARADGRPVTAQGDVVVLEPLQYLWLRG